MRWSTGSFSMDVPHDFCVRIHGLRRKINAEGEKPLIRAVKDMGYVLE